LKSELKGINTIIFDLGGVVLDLNQNLTAKWFAELAGISIPEVYDIFVKNEWAAAFERGQITAQRFRDEVRKSFNLNISDAAIDSAWNAMLLDLPKARIELIGSLRSSFNTFVLSNTNEIHIAAFNTIMNRATGGTPFENYFNKVYYSHEIGMRKPDLEIFNFVIEEQGLNPNKTLFIDDMEQNILAAKEAGLQALHLTDQDYLTELFANA
jgi:putative hydrolase of the HAD superfamily